MTQVNEQGDKHAVVLNMANTLQEFEALDNTRGDAHALVETLAGVTSLRRPELRLVRA